MRRHDLSVTRFVSVLSLATFLAAGAACRGKKEGPAGGAPAEGGPATGEPAKPSGPTVPALSPAEPMTIVTTLGERGGPKEPRGVAVDAAGNVFVTDLETARIVKFDPSGRQVGTIGRRGSGAGEFQKPWMASMDGSGNLAVLDPQTGRVQFFGPDGKLARSIGQDEGFYSPGGLAVQKDGTFAVADTGGDRVVVFGPDGRRKGSPITSTPRGPMKQPTDVCFDAAGNLYVVQPEGGPDGKGILAKFNPGGGFDRDWLITFVPSTADTPRLAAAADGRILLADVDQGRILAYAPDGSKATPYQLQAGTKNRFIHTAGIAIDAKGVVWVVDSGAHATYGVRLGNAPAPAAPAAPAAAATSAAPH